MGKTRILTEGAILLAIFLIFMLISLYVIGLGMVAIFLLPLPFIIFTIKYGYKKSIILVGAALLASIAIGSPLTIFAALMFASTGVVIGEQYRQKNQEYMALLAGSITFLINMVLIYVLFNVFLQVNIINDALKGAKEGIKSSTTMLKSLGQEPNEEMIGNLNNMFDTIQMLAPSAFIVGAVLFTLVSLMICKPILKRLKLTEYSWPPFRNVVLPKSLLWYYLIAMLLMFVKIEQGTFMYTAIVNVFYLLQFLMIVQGFSFIAFYSYQKGYKKVMPISVVILAFIIPFLMDIIRILGIIDLGFNLRKRLTNDT